LRGATKAEQHWVYWIRLGVPRYPARDMWLEWGVRILNEDFPGLHLNGGQIDGSSQAYNTWFVDSDESEARCAAELVRIVKERAVPWCASFGTSDALLAEGSPLRAQARGALQQALSGQVNSAGLAKSMALLGRGGAA